MSALRLQTLDEETWGERFRRAKERCRPKISLKEAAARIRALGVTKVSYSTLMRLEWLDEPPADYNRRLLAYLALIIYGYEPEEFGLSDRDLPRWITRERLASLRSSDERL